MRSVRSRLTRLAPTTALLLAIAAAAPLAARADVVVRRTVQGHTLTDARGNRWAPAGTAFLGGSVSRVRSPPIQSGSPQLYTYSRVGVSRISLPVPQPGRYSVVLYLAEPKASGPGRIFDVYAGSRLAAGNVSIFIDPIQRRPLHALFETVVSGRRLALTLRARRGGAPAVSAIEARRLGPTTLGPPRELWRDDFNGPAGTSPDPALWVIETGNFSHNELGTMTDRPENVSMDGQGDLALTARRESFDQNGQHRDYTSGRIHSAIPVALNRGSVLARIKPPGGGIGLWGDFWFYGHQPPEYPYNGEFDVFEYNSGLPRMQYTFFHFGRSAKDDQWVGGRQADHPLDGAFHDYEIRTEPGAVEVLIDGRRHSSWTRADLPKGARWNLANVFDLTLSLAVGGDFVNPPTADTPFPRSYLIDRVVVTG